MGSSSSYFFLQKKKNIVLQLSTVEILYIPKHVFQFYISKKFGRTTFETLYVLTRYIANWQNDRQNANRR